MAEITQQAYEDLRSYIQSNWKYIELQDESNQPIIRLDTSDSRVTSTIEGKNVKIEIVVKGSDGDITAPITIAQSAIFKVGVGGQPYSNESFTPFTIESDDDELTVIHTIEVPRV